MVGVYDQSSIDVTWFPYIYYLIGGSVIYTTRFDPIKNFANGNREFSLLVLRGKTLTKAGRSDLVSSESVRSLSLPEPVVDVGRYEKIHTETVRGGLQSARIITRGENHGHSHSEEAFLSSGSETQWASSEGEEDLVSVEVITSHPKSTSFS